MDSATGLCRGCGRTLEEIARWGSMSDDERRSVMDGLVARAAQVGLALVTAERK